MSDVIRIKDFRRRDPPIESRGYPRKCLHKRVVLDYERRILECRDCQAVVDPFEYCASLAVEMDRYNQSRQALTTEIDYLRKTHDELKNDVRNLKRSKKRHAS